jgi:hypothetical protein
MFATKSFNAFRVTAKNSNEKESQSLRRLDILVAAILYSWCDVPGFPPSTNASKPTIPECKWRNQKNLAKQVLTLTS